MKGDEKVIDYLNRILTNELTATNQYLLHARMFKNWGLKRLDDHEYKESMEEMKHADQLIERILFLEGRPNLQNLDRLSIGHDVGQCLTFDLQREMTSHSLLREAINYVEHSGDYVSHELLEDIMADEEAHIDWIETQIGLIEKIGMQNYLQTQVAP